jgi:hypothetical protein
MHKAHGRVEGEETGGKQHVVLLNTENAGRGDARGWNRVSRFRVSFYTWCVGPGGVRGMKGSHAAEQALVAGQPLAVIEQHADALTVVDAADGLWSC